MGKSNERISYCIVYGLATFQDVSQETKTKRQKLQDKIKSTGAGDKVMEEIRKKLVAYKRKEDGEI
jgi:hypothetical protein